MFSIAPLLVLLLAIVALNWFMPPSLATQTPSREATAVPPQISASTTNHTPSPILQATILPSPTPTATPLPAVVPEASITLLGPPAEGNFSVNDRIAFYWAYSEDLLPGQEFLFTLRENAEILAASSLRAPNFGTAYQIVLDMTDVVTEGETAVWQVQLQWQNIDQPLLASENRTLSLMKTQ
ncbi:MAG: hypothetical protein KC433_03660 [Anaerolineales bacterium]|nr:hypothetical protein [Anaerolineales bacterium]